MVRSRQLLLLVAFALIAATCTTFAIADDTMQSKRLTTNVQDELTNESRRNLKGSDPQVGDTAGEEERAFGVGNFVSSIAQKVGRMDQRIGRFHAQMIGKKPPSTYDQLTKETGQLVQKATKLATDGINAVKKGIGIKQTPTQRFIAELKKLPANLKIKIGKIIAQLRPH